MPTTPNFQISKEWSQVSALAGIPAGTKFSLRNHGKGSDYVEVFASPSQPAEAFNGDKLDNTQAYEVHSLDEVWIRYVRFNSISGINKEKLTVSIEPISNVIISPISVLSPMMTAGSPSSQRLRVSDAPREQIQISQGEFFVGSRTRAGILINDDTAAVLKASPGHYLVIEGALPIINFSGDNTGQYAIQIDGYVKDSPINSWTYTPGTPLPIGAPLNTGFAKSLSDYPQSTADFDVDFTVVSGEPEYPLFFLDHFIESQGARESITTTGGNFFDEGRQIILPPGDELLVRTRTSGTSANTAEIKTIFFTSEIKIEDVPSLLGVDL